MYVKENPDRKKNDFLTYLTRTVLTYPSINFGFESHNKRIIFYNLVEDTIYESKENHQNHGKQYTLKGFSGAH